MFSSSSFVCGAFAGFIETSVCHPLDTIKTRFQNRSDTLRSILKLGPLRLYRGLTTVYAGVIPKNAIRFSTYDMMMEYTSKNTFLSGVTAGAVEAVLVVNPTDMIKIRLQTHSLVEPTSRQTPGVMDILRQERWRLFTRGVHFTILRQSVNQSTNFAVHHHLVHDYEMPSMMAGFFSGAVGPILNNPLDVIKTRLQTFRQKTIQNVFCDIYREKGVAGFYRGLTPRLARIMPGQAITFGVYDACMMRV